MGSIGIEAREEKIGGIAWSCTSIAEIVCKGASIKEREQSSETVPFFRGNKLISLVTYFNILVSFVG